MLSTYLSWNRRFIEWNTRRPITLVDTAPDNPKLIHTKPKTSEDRGQYCLLPLTICQLLCDESLERCSKFTAMGLQNRRKMTSRNNPRTICQFRETQILFHEMEGDMFVGECLNGGKGLIEIADIRSYSDSGSIRGIYNICT